MSARLIWWVYKIRRSDGIIHTKAVQLDVPVTAIQEAIQKQNDMAGAGFFETGTDRIQTELADIYIVSMT